MAVRANARPIDRALDELARLTEAARQLDVPDQLLTAATIAGLWEIVAEHAVKTNDAQLLVVASREREHARRAFHALDPP
jgi:hypothetical protein